MNPNQSNLDPLILQRLVDGELDTQQVQEILAQAQSLPQQWETIAVGFIENQAWQQALNSRFIDHANNLSCSDVERDLEVGSELKPELKTGLKQQQSKRAGGAWWVMAASLLAAASIGYMTSQIQNRSLPISSIAENDSSAGAPLVSELNTAATPVALTPDFHVEVPQESGFTQGQDVDTRVPVYRVTNVDQLKQFQAQRDIESAFPRKFVEQLSDSGYQIEHEIEFVSGQVDDQSFVVPLRTIRFIPGQ